MHSPSMRKESVEALLSRTQRETLRHPTLDQPDTLLVTNDKMHAALTVSPRHRLVCTGVMECIDG